MSIILLKFIDFIYIFNKELSFKNMRKKSIQITFIIFCFIFFNEKAVFADEKTLVFAAIEREPYIGVNLKENGYVAQLVTEAFKRVGYKVKIEFYPIARASYLTEKGLIDGQLPSYFEKSTENILSYSDPFPGDNIVLLKKMSLKINPKILNNNLQNLSQYTFGVVRGMSVSKEFDKENFLKKQFASSDILNIDKLMNDRFDFAVIDKFTAADIIVKDRPNYIGKIEVIKPPIATHSFHVAFSKKGKDYKTKLADFNRGLKMISRDGTLEKILNANGFFTPKKTVAGKRKVTIATVANSQMLIMQKLSKEFEKQNPNIELEWRVMEENTHRQRLLSDFLIKDGQFDVLTIGLYETPFWAKNNWLVPIKNFPKEYKLDDIFKYVRNSLSLNNSLHALPFYGESTITYYRKDLFAKAKITMPEAPTYNEIFKFAQAIHDPKNKLYALCLRGYPGWGANMVLLHIIVNTVGGRWFDEKWNTTIDTPEWHKAMQIYKDLLTKYGPPNPWEYNYYHNVDLFQKGHCGMMIDATSFADALIDRKNSKVYDQVGYANAPIDITPKGSHWLWVWALAVPVSSKSQSEALKFITWATSPQYNNLVGKNEGWLFVPPGTRTSVYKNKNYRAVAPFADIVLRAMETANPKDQTLKPVPYTGVSIEIPEFPALGLKIGDLLVEVLQEKKTIDQALKEAQSFVSTQMRAAGYTK